MFKKLYLPSFLGLLFFCSIYSCSKSELGKSAEGFGKSSGISSGAVGGGNGGNTPGVLTAGEWNDFDNWNFWLGLMNNDTFSAFQTRWGFQCKDKWRFTVVDQTNVPITDAMITVKSNGITAWTGRTNKFGIVDIIPSIYAQSALNNLTYTVHYNNSQFNSGSLTQNDKNIQVQLSLANTNPTNVDIMFVVDATGSMSDEINYLKTELYDVLQRVDNQIAGTMRYSSVFYRDFGDDYVTKVAPFTTQKNDITNFVQQQAAGGGGDFPEAVHEALQKAMQQNWSPTAKAKILFLILDAPVHDDAAKIGLLKSQIQLAASKGIMVIPVAASGIDKATEFLCRFMALATNSTYTFLTNHSGIGGNHITPTVGNYNVEFLNNLMVRLITKYGGN